MYYSDTSCRSVAQETSKHEKVEEKKTNTKDVMRCFIINTLRKTNL